MDDIEEKTVENGRDYSVPEDEEISTHDTKPKSPPGCFQTRYLITFMTASGLFIHFLHRIDISIAIVAMVNQSYVVPDERNLSSECSSEDYNLNINNTNSETSNIQEGKYNWDKETQGLILASFGIGYSILQIPGGWISSRISAKWSFGLSMFCSGILSFFTPLSADGGLWCFGIKLIRALQGLLHGFVFPAFIALNAKWHPPQEVGILSQCANLGSTAGVLFALSVSGVLADYGFAGGWPSIFYVFGIITMVWFIAWCYFVYDSPDKHPRISDIERKFINDSIGLKASVKPPKVPWLKSLSSPAVWSHTILMFCSDFVFLAWQISIPQYLIDVLKYDISTVGLLSATPNLGLSIVAIIWGKLSDIIITRKILTTTVTRKMSVAVCAIPLAGVLYSTQFVGCDRILAVVFLNLPLTIGGFLLPVIFGNPLDLTRHHAGIMFGIGKTAGAIGGMVAPYLVGYLTNDEPTRERWQILFNIAASLALFCMIFFLIFGSGERQKWDLDADSTNQAESEQEKTANVDDDNIPFQNTNLI